MSDILTHRSWILQYLRERYAARTAGEEAMYVNMAGGSRRCSDMAAVAAWLEGMAKYGSFIAFT